MLPKMKYLTIMTFRTIFGFFALSLFPLGLSQISDEKLDSIFIRLSGEDYDARYAARIDLHDEVSKATAPGDEAQQPLVESQLLERLSSEKLLTTRLWILRQLEAIGSSASLPALEALLKSDDPKLADGARMAMNVIAPGESPVVDSLEGHSRQDLAKLARTAPNRADRSMAFSQLAKKDTKLASEVLSEADDSSIDFLRVAMTAKNKGLQKRTLALLPTTSPEKQIVILGALPRRPSARLEKTVLSLLGSGNETLELQALEAIGRVGSSASLEALLDRIGAKDRDIREMASDSLSLIQDDRIDRILKKAAFNGAIDERTIALEALSLRAIPEAAEIVNRFAADRTLDIRLREVAVSAMEQVGNVESFPILVGIVVNDENAGLAKDAQKTLKRMSLRLANPEAAWSAFKAGFEIADRDKRLALMLVSDSAASQKTIDYLLSSWDEGDERIQKMVLRVLPNWRSWDGGFALLDLAEKTVGDEATRTLCFKGIANLILGSDATYPIEEKFELAELALKAANSPEEREIVINGFRTSTGKDRAYVASNEVDSELKAAVIAFRKK